MLLVCGVQFPLRLPLQVFQGIILAESDRFRLSGQALPVFGGNVTSPEGYLLGLWAHECQRVFADKLITLEDKAWVQSTVTDLCKQVRSAPCCPSVALLASC